MGALSWLLAVQVAAVTAQVNVVKLDEATSFCLDAALPRIQWRSRAIFESAAVSISIHFAALRLPPRVSLVVRTLSNRTTNLTRFFDVDVEYSDVFSPRVFAKYVTLELVRDDLDDGTNASTAACGYVAVDMYEYTTTETKDSNMAVPGQLEQGCGRIDESAHAVCSFDPTNSLSMYAFSRAVMRLVVRLRDGGSLMCTGWLWGSAGHVLTTRHCVGSPEDARRVQFEFKAESPWCQAHRDVTCSGIPEATTATWLASNEALDYTLLQLPREIPARYGYLQAGSQPITVGTPVYIPQHPRGGCKLISSQAYDGNRTSVLATDGYNCDSLGGKSSFRYNADTDHGSSGAPVMHADTHVVLGLHFCGGQSCQNAGMAMSRIVADVAKLGLLPPNAIASQDGVASAVDGYPDPRFTKERQVEMYKVPPLLGEIRRVGTVKKPYLTSVDRFELTAATPVEVIVDVLAFEFNPETLACMDLIPDCRITSFQASVFVFSKYNNISYKAYSNAGISRALYPDEGRLDGSIMATDPYLVADLPPGTHIVALGGMGLSLTDAMAGVNSYRYVDFYAGSRITLDPTASVAYQITITSTGPIRVRNVPSANTSTKMLKLPDRQKIHDDNSRPDLFTETLKGRFRCPKLTAYETFALSSALVIAALQFIVTCLERLAVRALTMARVWASYKYSIAGRTRTSDVSTRTESMISAEKTASNIALGRVTSNVVAGTLIFLPMLTLIVLVFHGMFDRLVVSVNSQTESFFWSDYGQSCALNGAGWVLNTCDAATMAVAPDNIFATVGTVLSQQWSKEIAEAGGKLYVTTCVLGGTSDVGWTDMQFIAGYDYFPACLPAAPQDVAGMAMLETTIRDGHVDGLYLITLYSDLDPSMVLNLHVLECLTTSRPERTLVTSDGQTLEDSFGGDFIINSRPLGERYLVMSYCVTEIEELSDVIVEQGLTGWSQGKHSKHPVVPGWACGHKVSHAQELIALQIVFAIGTWIFFAGDIFITFEGFRGVLQGKPVLTYTVLSGLERRKILLIFVVLNAMPGLLYADVARIYYFTTNGFKIWCLSIVMVANFFSFGLVLAVSVLDMVPIQLTFVVSYSAPIFLYSSIAAISIACCNDTLFQFVYNGFYSATPFLSLHVNGADWPSGSYTAAGTPPVLTYLANNIMTPLFVAFGCSIALATIYRAFVHKSALMYLGWCKTNGFLSFAKTPNFITALPLEQTNAIKIGNKMYCKPSTQALMGYATVIDDEPLVKTTDQKKLVKVNHVISIYALVPSKLLSTFIREHGVILRNEFTPKMQSRLEKKSYHHTRGACVV
ncbi:hypothetical protein LEN26_007572 [Aphanomyces euteiches]|nr:hypothetical protein LEN26_007572 [Aphanomyces euteiches]